MESVRRVIYVVHEWGKLDKKSPVERPILKNFYIGERKDASTKNHR